MNFNNFMFAILKANPATTVNQMMITSTNSGGCDISGVIGAGTGFFTLAIITKNMIMMRKKVTISPVMVPKKAAKNCFML